MSKDDGAIKDMFDAIRVEIQTISVILNTHPNNQKCKDTAISSILDMMAIQIDAIEREVIS